MKLNVSGHDMEIFETKGDYIRFVSDQLEIKMKSKYHGRLYGIPQELKVDLVELKKKCYINVEYVLIY